jgi:hypothetical protein
MNMAADDFNRLLANLDPNDALPILIELGKVPETRMSIVELAKASIPLPKT